MVFVIAMSIIYKSKFYNAGFGISDHPMAYDTKIGVTKNRHRGFQMSSVCCCWVETIRLRFILLEFLSRFSVGIRNNLQYYIYHRVVVIVFSRIKIKW